MKRALLLGASRTVATRALVTLACVAAIGAGAFAAGGTTIVNKSNYDVDHLYTSAPGKNAWSDDLMIGVKEAIDAGKTEAVQKLVPGTYDLKMTDDDEVGAAPCIVKNVKVKAGAPLTLTKKMVKGCK